MQERFLGAMLGLAALAGIYGLSTLPRGWAAAIAFAGAGGWLLGGYVRHVRRQAEHDPLTGLNNRRPFERALRVEWQRALRYDRPLSLLFVELDDFGQINKYYGHIMGDKALRAVAYRLNQSIRGTDAIARWGGDEFVILLPETDTDNALILAERIRETVAESLVRDLGRSISVTISAGVATHPGAARTPSQLLRMAIEGQRMAKVTKNAVAVVS